MPKRSSGSSIGAIAGLIVMFAFFLPWVRSCAGDFSGYDLARNTPGIVEDAWLYWLTLAAGIVCLGLFLVVNTDARSSRIGAAIIRLVVGLIGVLPLINIWLNVRQQGEGLVEILYGAYLLAFGYAGIFISSIVDLLSPGDDEAKDPDNFKW